MQSSSTSSTGELLQTFRYGKALPISLSVFGVVLLALAGFVLYLRTILPTGNPGPVTLHTSRGMDLTFSSQDMVFWATAGLLAVLAVGMFGLSVWQKKLRQASYEVYEKGITQLIGTHRHYTPYSEIHDLYLFSSGQTLASGLINNLAYRRNPSEPFNRVNAHLSGFNAFLQLVRERYVHDRLPGVIETLQAGGAVTFNFVGTGQVWGKRVSGNFLKVSTQPIVVTREALEVQGRTVPMASLRSVDLNAWTEKVVIKDDSGKTVFATLGTGIMSHDLFLSTLDVLLGGMPVVERAVPEVV